MQNQNNKVIIAVLIIAVIVLGGWGYLQLKSTQQAPVISGPAPKLDTALITFPNHGFGSDPKNATSTIKFNCAQDDKICSGQRRIFLQELNTALTKYLRSH